MISNYINALVANGCNLKSQKQLISLAISTLLPYLDIFVLGNAFHFVA
jgi:hypothetical protein